MGFIIELSLFGIDISKFQKIFFKINIIMDFIFQIIEVVIIFMMFYFDVLLYVGIGVLDYYLKFMFE